jgi:hypothetical protein
MSAKRSLLVPAFRDDQQQQQQASGEEADGGDETAAFPSSASSIQWLQKRREHQQQQEQEQHVVRALPPFWTFANPVGKRRQAAKRFAREMGKGEWRSYKPEPKPRKP